MDQTEKRKIEESLNIIAQKEGITITEVREKIALAVSYALKSTDNNIQHFWKDIPCEGIAPTIEEIIDFLVEQIAIQ